MSVTAACGFTPSDFGRPADRDMDKHAFDVIFQSARRDEDAIKLEEGCKGAAGGYRVCGRASDSGHGRALTVARAETGCCWDRERMSRPGWTARRIDRRRALSGVWTYQRTLRGSGCAGAWQASSLRRGYRPAQDPAKGVRMAIDDGAACEDLGSMFQQIMATVLTTASLSPVFSVVSSPFHPCRPFRRLASSARFPSSVCQ
jgi:hypothetical protein